MLDLNLTSDVCFAYVVPLPVQHVHHALVFRGNRGQLCCTFVSKTLLVKALSSTLYYFCLFSVLFGQKDHFILYLCIKTSELFHNFLIKSWGSEAFGEVRRVIGSKKSILNGLMMTIHWWMTHPLSVFQERNLAVQKISKWPPFSKMAATNDLRNTNFIIKCLSLDRFGWF